MNRMDKRYNNDQPVDNPVRTVYPQVSEYGGQRDERIAKQPATTKRNPQKLIGAASSAVDKAVVLDGGASAKM